MRYAYYPGCSLESTAREYDLSVREACGALGVELVELEDWSCCGATSAHSTNHLLALALPARNLAQASEAGLDLAVPCSACYNRLKTADTVMRRNKETRRQVEAVAEIRYARPVQVYSLLEAVVRGAGLEAVAEKVKRPLKGLKLACYYGCLLVRPPGITGFDRPENPVSLDRLVEALGAKAVQWSYKTECCGASLALSSSETVYGLVGALLDMAEEAGAHALVTSCPLCRANLEMRRQEKHRMPVFYFTELMGHAFGLPGSHAWFQKHLVDPEPLLHSLGL
ncbi:MAG: CoB--CoM heterodisulfide reductase iron-sulfur subunit B family protein [Peptococcaceae bacterium]|nr:CoB--CoM heterodisulfide reductase iron-sulfur subunit B family protein [Peptococcaceae bacterium]